MLFIFVLQDGQVSGMVVEKGDFEDREDVGNGWDRYLFSVGRGMLVRERILMDRGYVLLGNSYQVMSCRDICNVRDWFRSMKWRE